MDTGNSRTSLSPEAAAAIEKASEKRAAPKGPNRKARRYMKKLARQARKKSRRRK